MIMQNLAGARVAVSARTLTVKDNTGKTRGMVRGVTQFVHAAPRVQMEHSRALRASGLWEAVNAFDYLGVASSVIIDGGRVYWLFNRRWEGCDALQALRDRVTVAGIEIIDCEIV